MFFLGPLIARKTGGAEYTVLQDFWINPRLYDSVTSLRDQIRRQKTFATSSVSS
jgi:hypothetical protein